jgi:hypothetical protein
MTIDKSGMAGDAVGLVAYFRSKALRPSLSNSRFALSYC